ncbi:MAG: hypothetical protein H8E12_16755 [Rhodobacteraceae bacterium]|nr:hypothetical protein [Paracoccaceae bacterium]
MRKNSFIKFTEEAKIQFDDVKDKLDVPSPYALQVIVDEYTQGEVKFSFLFKEASGKGETALEHKGFKYIVDSMSAVYLHGSTFDFRDGAFVLDLGTNIDFSVIGEA